MRHESAEVLTICFILGHGSITGGPVSIQRTNLSVDGCLFLQTEATCTPTVRSTVNMDKEEVAQ